MDQIHSDIAYFVVLLVAAVGLGTLAERIRLPYIVTLMLASAPLYFPNLPFQFGPALLVVFLPALVFEAAWNLDHRALERTWKAIAILALPGVVWTAAVVGFGLFVLRQLPLPQAFLLGVILSATDPVAVIGTFRRLKVPLDLATIVEGESLFNDGAAVVLYGVVVAVIEKADSTTNGLFAAAIAIGGSFGGVAVGLAVAFLVARLLRFVSDPSRQVVVTVVAAYGAYVLADIFHLSGIFAAIVTGVGLRAFERGTMTDVAAEDIDRFWDILAFLANSILFLLVGLRIEFARIIHQPMLVISTLVLLVLSRVVLSYGCLPLIGIRGERTAWRHVVTLAGMRGALSLALALAIPQSFASRPQIVDAVFAVVFITLVAQGIAIGPAVARSRL